MHFNAKNGTKREIEKPPVSGSFRMKNIRSLVLLALAVLLLIPVTELFGVTNITTDPVDARRIGPNTADVRVLAWSAEGNGTADSLKKVTMTSFNERTYAGKQYALWVWDNSDSTRHLLKTLGTENIPFQTNDKLSFSDCLWVINSGTVDTFYVLMDANTTHIQGLADAFDTTGIKIKVLMDEMFWISDPDGSGVTPADTVTNAATIENAGVCISRPEGTIPCFEIEFDTRGPKCSLLVDQIYDGCKLGSLDLGDSIWIRFEDTTCFSHYDPAMTFEDSVFQSRNFPDTIAVEISHYMTRSGSGPLWLRMARPWSLRYMIPDSVVRVPIDTLEGLRVYAYIRDTADNKAMHYNTWPVRVDTKRPWFDSKSWAHIYNVSGLPTTEDTVVAIGDSLKFTIITTLSNFIPGEREIDSVKAHFYTCGLVEAAKDTLMSDVGSVIVNGNTIWELKIATEGFNCPRDLDKGVNTDGRGWVVFTAWDNGCNTYIDSIEVAPKLDLNAPDLSTWTYTTYRDVDQNGCTGLGDTVQVRISLIEGVTDVVAAHSDHLEAGIGSLREQALAEESDSVWILRTLLIENDPGYAKDDNPLKRKGDVDTIYEADARYTDSVVVVDDAGNTAVKVITLDNGGRDLDTRRPLQVKADAITVQPLQFGVLKLKWDRAYQDVDAAWFYVYSDSGKAAGTIYYPTDPDQAFGSLYDKEPPCEDTLHNCWTSDPLTHGQTYKFVVRTVDNCGNFDLNSTVITGMADAIADKACVAWPVTGGNFGPDKPLAITATTTATDLDFAWAQYRMKDVGGFPGPWYYSDTTQVDGATTFYFPSIVPGLTAYYTGAYELFIMTQDYAGNVLVLDSAKTCAAFDFNWFSNPLEVDILSINDAGSPQTQCGYNVWRDSVNTAIVTVTGAVADPVYTMDSWVIYYYAGDPAVYDSVRIEFKDLQAVPFTYTFSVADWPKSNDGFPTMLYVRVTDTRNGTAGIDSVELCVPDVVAPDIFMTRPTAYSRVPIAKSSLNAVPVRAKISALSYDPDNPIRVEFFYALDAATLTWVKIDEAGTPWMSTKGFTGGTALANPYPEYGVLWDNSLLAEGYVWLKAIVHDQVDNTSEAAPIKVYLDKTAPLMKLTMPDAIMVNGMLTIKEPADNKYIDLVAEITNNNIDIADVEFFISYRDSVDLVKFYHKIGDAFAGTENSIWRYRWYGVEDWSWLKCGYDYKLRIKVTDIAGNVYDDNDGDDQFDDYTFWANPFVTPITLMTPADDSKLIFYYDCGAPQVAIYEVGTDNGTPSEARTYETPSSRLGGPGEVYMKMGETLTVQSIVLDSLNDLGGVKMVEYFFYSPVYSGYKSVGLATASPFSVSFDPFALGLITQEDVQVNEYDGTIKAVLTDSLNQTTNDDITCWVLDNFPGDSKWRTPTHPYVWGTVDLSIWALNGEGSSHNSYRQVVYKYKQAGGDWTTIATVTHSEGADHYFTAQWPTLNVVQDGSYLLGFETTDKNLNVQAVEDNPQITVIVQNALPTVTITSPDNGAFFCEDQYFTADATNGPVGTVDFQWKPVTSSSWTAFPGNADNFPPYGKYFTADTLADGYYHFRAYATNQAGRTAYSDPIILFSDETDPLARITDLKATLGGETDTVDVEWRNDGSAWINKAIGTVQVTTVAFDTLSPKGSQSIYNSGIAWVGLYLTNPGGPGSVELAKEYPNPADSGYYTFAWDISGLPTGDYKLVFEAWDNVGCNVGVDTVNVHILEFRCPVSLVAGFWQPVPGQGKIVGVTYEDETVQFQYKQTGDWIPIGIGRDEDADKSLFYPDQRWQTYSVYAADWAPADGAYQLRMLTNCGEEYSPVLSVTIAGGVMTAVGPTTGTWGPGTIEKNQEEGCDLEGVARFTSTYGFPFAVSISMDLDDLNFEYELIDFRNLPQQNPVATYAGPFQFYEMQDGGPAWGQVFFCDNVETVGYSYGQHLAAYWITQDLGSGGPITYVSANLKDTTTVTIPPEWNDDPAGYEDALVIWESSKPAQCVWLDWLLTPVGNRSGLSNYVGAPGYNCDEYGGEGDDERYAIVKMTYDATCNAPQESLMVAWWDGEGDWLIDDIFFPSTVAGFDTPNHTVEFAATSLHGTYAVIKRTPNVCQEIVTRKDAFPICGQYTSGYPTFWYQFVEAFTYTMDWSTLEVKVDGILVYEGGNYYVGGVKVAPSTALDGEARHWDIDIDEVSAVVSVQYRQPDDGVLDDPRPLACGNHTIWIGAKDSQLRGQCLTDPFVVDCTKPVVEFPNEYVGKNPTIQFSVTDDLSGVAWDSLHVDIFFVTKYDTTAGGPDYSTPKERVAFMQTFYPDQIKNYMTGNGNVAITTTYELDDERAVLAVIYNGHRKVHYYDEDYEIDPGAYEQFYEFYYTGGGASDCVGNNATPHMQYLAVDYEAPRISLTSTSGSCPMLFRIVDDGAGLTENDIVIRENGAVLSTGKQASASAVNASGEWFFLPSGEGGLLYYCPNANSPFEVLITDKVGNQGTYLGQPTTPLSEGDLMVTMSNNPFDPTVEPLTLGITLKKSGTVTAKIYDMGGDLVRTLSPMVGGNLFWDGKTEGGTTMVANGVYLAHIVAEGSGGSVSTVVKIAVVKK
jgi:hypothetical protein